MPRRCRAFLSVFAFFLVLAFLSSLVVFSAFAQDSSSHHHHDSTSMAMNKANDPAAQAKLLADKKESEFNHHLAGVFVILAGLFILIGSRFESRWLWFKYAWPLCFFLSGIFVLVFSDTELWPFGPKNWWIGVTGNLEVLQHKTFAAILLILGIIEFLRARGSVKGVWSAWVFPALAVAGSVMLLFHAHDAGMHGADAPRTMERIQAQHFAYAALGACIAVSKGVSESRVPFRRLSSYLWPSLMIALGLLLTFYTE